MSTPNWYVVTGGPSSGKTTLLKELEATGHTTFEESARLVIDEGIAEGKTIEQIRADERKFQEAVLKRKLEVELALNKDTLSFFDRGMHDTVAYYNFYKWEVDAKMTEIMKNAKYKAIFLLDTLPIFEKDYARTEDHNFTKTLKNLLRQAYVDHGMPVIDVPVLSPKERAQFILDQVRGNHAREGNL